METFRLFGLVGTLSTRGNRLEQVGLFLFFDYNIGGCRWDKRVTTSPDIFINGDPFRDSRPGGRRTFICMSFLAIAFEEMLDDNR